MRGRKPKPTTLKLLTGNPGKRRLNTAEPRPRKKRPPCPSWLPEPAKAKWYQLAKHLAELGLFTEVDGDALTRYCEAWADFRDAVETLEREGKTVACGQDGEGVKAHPAVQRKEAAEKRMRANGELFGLDPSSRTRLKVGEGDKPQGITVRDRTVG